MKPGMRFLAASRVRSNNTNTTEGIRNPSGEMGMYSPHSNYEMEARRYKRYDNGRFAPHNDMSQEMESRRHSNGRYAPHSGGERFYDIDIVRNGMETEMQDGYRSEMRGGGNSGYGGRSEMEMNDYGRSEMEMERRNPVGFNARFDSPGKSDASYQRMENEMESRGGPKMEHGGAKSQGGKPKLDEKMASEWAMKMQNEDGTRGPHWTKGQVREIMEERGIGGQNTKWWVAMNMVYSDYCKAARKLGVNIVDFCVELARAFCEDKDAKAEDKLAAYYTHVVKGE